MYYCIVKKVVLVVYVNVSPVATAARMLGREMTTAKTQSLISVLLPRLLYTPQDSLQSHIQKMYFLG